MFDKNDRVRVVKYALRGQTGKVVVVFPESREYTVLLDGRDSVLVFEHDELEPA